MVVTKNHLAQRAFAFDPIGLPVQDRVPDIITAYIEHHFRCPTAGPQDFIQIILPTQCRTLHDAAPQCSMQSDSTLYACTRLAKIERVDCSCH